MTGAECAIEGIAWARVVALLINAAFWLGVVAIIAWGLTR